MIWDVTGWISDTSDQARAGGFQSILSGRPPRPPGRHPAHRRPDPPLQVASRAGVDTGTATAEVMNVTAANGVAPGFLTVWPDRATRPLASNVNFDTGQTVASRAIVPLGTGGGGDIWSPVDADAVVDLNGTFSTETAPKEGGSFVATTPTRFLDTRKDMGTTGIGGSGAVGAADRGPRWDPHRRLAAQPDPRSGGRDCHRTGGGRILLDLGRRRALAGHVGPQLEQGQTVPNLVVVQVNKFGAIRILNHGECSNVVVDVVGWFTGPVASSTPADPSIWTCPPPPGPAPTQLIIPKIGVNAAVEQDGYDLTIPAPGDPTTPRRWRGTSRDPPLGHGVTRV